MKKMLLVLIVSVFGFSPVLGQDYYIQVTGIQRGDGYEPVSFGQIILRDNEMVGVDFTLIPTLKYEERIRGEKPGFIKKEGFHLFKEGIGMKTGFFYKIGVNLSKEEESDPELGLEGVTIDIIIVSYTNKMNVRMKGIMQKLTDF